MLEYQSPSDYDESNTGVSKSTHLEPKITHLFKETILSRRTARTFVSGGHNIRVEIFTLKSIRVCSIYNTIKKQLK